MTARFKDHILGPDTHTNRPAASGVPEAAIYECTTHGLIYKNVAGTWVTYAAVIPPGGTTGQALVKNSNTDLDVLWGSAGGGGIGDHGSRVKKNTTQQAITSGVVTALTWQTEDWDTDNFWVVGSSTRFTVPAGLGGKYRVGGAYTFDNATAFDQLISISLNGTELVSTRTRQGSAFAVMRTDTILNLVATDFVELNGYQGSGSSKSTPATANSAEFFIQKIT